MNNKQQTAVEWLIKIYLQTNKIDNFDIEQAKAMEKQQMFEFWNGGIDCTEERGKSFEQYYKETYETQE
jgi:hypothetical protein